MSTQGFDDLDAMMTDENIPESNWFKFDQVGAKVGGILEDNPSVKPDNTGEYGDQRVFKLRQPDGSFINVGINLKKTYIIERTNHVRRGDWVGFKFEKEIPAQKKGYRPAKSITVYVKLTEEGNREREIEKDFAQTVH